MSNIIRPTRRWFALGVSAAAAGTIAPASGVSSVIECSKVQEWRALVAARAMVDPSRASECWQALDEFERAALQSPPGSLDELRLAVAVARRAIVADDPKRHWAPRAVLDGAAQFFGIEAGEAAPEKIV
jgi:hypothetical protein